MPLLSDVFQDAAYKVLVAVDVDPARSHQHEFNSTVAMRRFFAESYIKDAPITIVYLSDLGEVSPSEGTITHYDARLKSYERTRRSEWRVYYSMLPERAAEDDLLLLARTHSGELYALIFDSTSSWYRAAMVLFQLQVEDEPEGYLDQDALRTRSLELLATQILEQLPFDFALPTTPTDQELVAYRFPNGFPSTNEMSTFAREVVAGEIGSTTEYLSDSLLVAWLTREEALFRAIEANLVSVRLETGFESVDDFIRYSLSVQNRRKSRMGHAFQNHLAALFALHNLHFDAQVNTEGKNRPDFIFPGRAAYHDQGFQPERLTMLAVKSTCKERWRQILTEAARIPSKHLCTLEPAISEDQTNEMAVQQVTLVLPEILHETYTSSQQQRILSVAGFIELVQARAQ